MKRILYRSINYRKKEHVAVIKINSPAKNHLEIAHLANELSRVFSEIILDEEIWVVLITGSGRKAFSMGDDLIAEIFMHNEQTGTKLCSIAEPIAKLDRPVIAGINGDAIGPGLELALACDIRISTEISHFGLPHIRKGLIPWDGGTQRLSRLVGRSKALELILTGEIIDAQEAYRIGLVNKLVPPNELMTVVTELTQEIASRAPIALRYAKEAVHTGMDLTLEQGLRLEADLYFLLHTTRDRAEGIRAFGDKRTPHFEGK